YALRAPWRRRRPLRPSARPGDGGACRPPRAASAGHRLRGGARRVGGPRADAGRGMGREGGDHLGDHPSPARVGVVMSVSRLSLLILAGATALVPVSAAGQPSPAPERPRLSVDTTYAHPPGRTIAVAAGGDLQTALNEARPGDVVALEAGATFAGPFKLPDKPASDWIVVRTSAPDSALPPPGTRVDPSYAKVMPKLVSASGGVIATAPGARHYRFIGI